MGARKWRLQWRSWGGLGGSVWFAASLLLATATLADDVTEVITEEMLTEALDQLEITTAALPTRISSLPTTEAVPSSTFVALPQDEPFITEPVFAFTSALYNATIPENSPGKTAVVPDEPMGIRSARFETIRYRIMSGDRDRFFKAEDRVVGDFCFLVIRIRTNNNDVLNRERKDKYIIEVKGFGVDVVTRRHFETNTTVIINILDVNDLKPLFFQSDYEVKIDEDTALHKSIIQMQADDADLGKNGEVYYSFLEPTEVFSIHPTSGMVSLTRPLKYHEKSLYELTVVAQDRGIRTGTGKPSIAKLRIKVKEVNLFAPEIYVHRLPQLIENSSSVIYGFVRVVDRDSGLHGQIDSVDIVDGDPDGHFRLQPKDGEFVILVKRPIDRESGPLGYNLTLRAVDRGLPPRQSFKSVSIKIADLNDNPPVFDREIYEVDIPEISPVNTAVIRLKVTDIDEGKNAQVFLEIVGGNEGNEFIINPYTGMLYTAVTLDAEEKSFYTLTVSAIDQGNSGVRKQSSAKVKINVIDTNDNDPTFEQDQLSVEINENEPAGTTVLKVTAKDRDSGENAYISYSIANLNPVPFEIDHFTGVIRTTTVLDYESMRRNYIIRVRASDWGLPFRRQSEMQVKIRVKDINDNRPQFERVDCRGHIPRYVPIGTEILTLSAIDFDAGNIISYRLVAGNKDNCFALDATTGILSVTCDLMDVVVGERNINVTATDGTHFADVTRVDMLLVTAKRLPGQGSLLADETGAFECRDTGVARRLTEVLASAEKNNMPQNQEEFAMMPSRYGENVHTPEFLNFPNEIKINESAPLGLTLLTIRARDRDLGYNGKLVFGISGGDQDSVFRIDAETGELKIVGYLDREREDEYLLNITVYDLGRPQKSLSRILPITVLDVNDNAPKFVKAVTSFRVTENANNGTAIFRVNATDADSGDNAKIVYSLVTDTSDFAVDPIQGILYVANQLDRERQIVYELQIRATDGGGKDSSKPPLFSDALIRVVVDDINDNAPTFALPNYTIKVREDIPTGSVVAVITASDPDVGEGGDIRYSLAQETDVDGVFAIDKLTGTLRTAKPLDFEERQIHNLVIRARDRGTPSLISETNLRVEIVDVNENAYAPVFSDFVVTSSVRENSAIGTSVTTVTAKDDDLPGDDSRVSYSIRGGDGVGLFTIDDKGQIKTNAILDIESKPHYWLTVYAQDHGVVPRYSRLEVFVAVENENDIVPLTDEPIYFASVAENSGSGKSVVTLHATDLDVDPNKTINFRITSGNPEGFFVIGPETGVIKTTARKLDRENQAEHILEVTVSDNGDPQLASTTRVIINIEDVNDHTPEFAQQFYKVLVPATETGNVSVFQNATEPTDSTFDLEPWESEPKGPLSGTPLFRVLAHDEDVGDNGEVDYSIKSGRGKGRFKVHPKTGVVYSIKPFQAGQEFDLMIRAADGGNPPRANTVRVSLSAVPVGSPSGHPPVIRSPQSQVQVTETDQFGYLVALVQANDEDGDKLWYNIVDGDPRDEYFIGRDNGNILLAKSLDRETQHSYSLNISVTDGFFTVYTQLHVMVIDSNDHRPEFSRHVYAVDISESVPVGTEVVELHASDRDQDDKVVFALHAARTPASLEMFHLDSATGALTLTKQLDRESIAEHVLVVVAKDHGTPSQKNFARVHIQVHDHNDHAPSFASPIIQGKVYETAEVGTTVARVLAVDRDRGANARIAYSIISGNVGNVFSIDPALGDLELTRYLDYGTVSEYMLMVRASDSGNPPLASTLPVHIMVTMADNAPPRFIKNELAAELMENQQLGAFVAHVEARATSSVFFELIAGNIDDTFLINPSTGVVLTKNNLDYERTKLYNLTVEATNMAGAKSQCFVIVHVLDRNDNPPHFLQATYSGFLLESALIGSLVFTEDNTPLVIKATDPDSELNALLSYEIIEALPRKYFHIDSTTGAIRTVSGLDHETIPTFTFHVRVSDVGKPRLSAEAAARVVITVQDVNDCAPTFDLNEYNATLLLPTYAGVAVLQPQASDRDARSTLRYDLIEGNTHNAFRVDSNTGLLSVSDPSTVRGSKLTIRVSDGKFSSSCIANIRVERSDNSGLVFQKPFYSGSILENSTKVNVVTVVNVLGSALNENVIFTILNPTDMFVIGKTSGVISTVGKKFDREVKDRYDLIIEARSSEDIYGPPRIAHVIVNVTILDINDNCPMFVNLPYYAVVSVTASKGDIVTNVHAHDLDRGENGEVRYELMKGHGELFKVCRKTGEITLKQSLDGHNSDYELNIAAYDGGSPPCRTEVYVRIKVIDKSMPVFDKNYYTVNVPEDIELHSPLALTISAHSPLDRKLIYSLVSGNDFEEFALDFNTAPDSSNGPCALYVVDNLDYETKRDYRLTVRATDGVSGVFAEVFVNVDVTDINDCPPEFTSDTYNVSVSEAAPFGTSVLKVVARDNDTGDNQRIRYELHNDGNSSIYFHVEPDEGIIYLKRSLDAETLPVHHLTIIATDMGVPSLSSTAHVWVTVLDVNDNAPKFEQPSYACQLSQEAVRGQFVTVVTSSDSDAVDLSRLSYTIVGGNEQQMFAVDPNSGVITLMNLQNFGDAPQYMLNVSVSDGVYTSFTRVRIDVQPANRHNPVFAQPQIDIKLAENLPKGTYVVTVKATDKDNGLYGDVTYSIASTQLMEIFEINSTSGEVKTLRPLDRETTRVWEVPITAIDGGGRPDFQTLRISVVDVNDNDPLFVLREIKTSIPSNMAVNSGFIKVKATDADEGSNAELEYSLLDPPGVAVQLFGIHRQNGGLSVVGDLSPYEGKVFQFFVKVSDKGAPARHTHLPVEVFVMAPDGQAPMFERKDDKFFMSEDATIGSVITKLKLVSNTSVTFRIVSGDPTSPQFLVDSTGQVTVAKPLDRETADSHVIAVMAETGGSPSLSAIAEIGLGVLDINDHAPKFESSPYNIVIAENLEEGSPILKVIAHDADQGSNRDIRYTLSADAGDLANIFAVNPHTGWVRTLVPLDRETTSAYTFQIIATDNGNQKHFARTLVNIKLKDYNDNPPIFSNDHYKAAVNEDALPGTVILELKTTDLDEMRSQVEFHITAGDPQSQFQVRRTGEVFVAKPLDREAVPSYDLTVTATDGKFVTVTKVTIGIIDANDNPPYCLRHRYREVLSEGVHIGTYILSVLASDQDEPVNADLRYYLTGDGAEHFLLDKDGGHLKTAVGLDHEEQSRYRLVAHVQDRERPRWECSSLIDIQVSDLNDNPPTFAMEQYSSTMPEDAQVGTLVTKLHATDKDIGINRKVKYTLVDSAGGHFKVETDSGIVTLAKPLDRESRASYNLSARASDQGTPQLSREVRLFVHVLDVNDNPPEFASKTYYASVPESESVGYEIVRVLATSKDLGVNAEVYYSIVGGNEHNKFAINPSKGVISISGTLDFERAKEYLLTIQAIDGGVPPLSNHATVNITVTDSNDNSPIFSQPSYTATIRENAQVGDKILQVIAHDLDTGDNGRIRFSIANGDRQGQFAVDPITGYLAVQAPLDREMMSSYVLEVQAADHGVPEQSSVVPINLDISDENDNPPLFTQSNYTAVVQEDKLPGHTILRFHVTDADTSPNTSPYTFDFHWGNEGSLFKLTQDGTLQTAAKLNHRVKDTYMLHIRVFDNGTPPKYSDTQVIVKVIEESQYPPVLTPLEVTINSFRDSYPGGGLGRVHGSDQDQYDTLSFSLSSPTSGLFDITPEGMLSAHGLDVGEYIVNVTVTDGKFNTSAPVKVFVEPITEEMLANAVVIRFRDISPQSFVMSHRKGFIRALRNSLGIRVKDVIIISVQPAEGRKRSVRGPPSKGKSSKPKGEKKKKKQEIKERSVRQLTTADLDVLFTVRNGSWGLLPADKVQTTLRGRVDTIEQSTGLVVEEIGRDRCAPGRCVYGKCQDKFVLDALEGVAVSLDVTSFVSPRHHQRVQCVCKEGYAGEHCELAVNECSRNPCPPSKVCIPDKTETGFSCVCRDGHIGSSCEVVEGPCIGDGCYGRKTPISFTGNSYAEYQVEKGLKKTALEERFSLSLWIRTVQLTGNLMYVAGKLDYNILEIVNGVVQFRFDLGTGEGLVQVADIFVSDGQWHEINLERDGKTARVVVDRKHMEEGSSPGLNDILNSPNDIIYLGAEVHTHPVIIGFNDVRRGFVGCMDDVNISRVSVPFYRSKSAFVATLVRFHNVNFYCDPSKNLVPLGGCGTQPCFNGGSCKGLDGDSYECVCHQRFMGANCEKDTDPCASSPCLNGGTCRNTHEGYVCECPGRLEGSRCQLGRFCKPNPCRNGGLCEEGDNGPLCKCRGYDGPLCISDVNECLSSPCLHGATCENVEGGYTCHCHGAYSGPLCATPLHSAPITSSVYNLTLEELVGIAAVLVAILLLVLCFVIFRKMRTKRTRHAANHINNDTRKDIVLNSTCKPHELVDFKRGSKLSNLEVSQRDTPGPPRPASYAAASEPHPPVPLNNLDSLRSYGSAGDELETELPPDYLRNLNRAALSSQEPDVNKATWPVIPLASFSDHSIKNDLKLGNSGRPVGKGLAGRQNVSSEEDQRYHWDCSDWARTDQRPLPNITEVPGSEVPDSSSFHSNESNESNSHNTVLPPVMGPLDPARDIDTLPEDQDSEIPESDLNDSEYRFRESDQNDSEYKFHGSEAYLSHPNSYLPRYNMTSASERDDSDEDYGYGFPRHETSALLGLTKADSLSNVCEIDDADLEAPELKKLNQRGVVHTAV